MTAEIVGSALADRLYAAEAALDTALAETAALTAMMPRARTQAHMPVGAGHPAVEAVAAAVAALSEARGHLARTHGRLADLALALGLDDLAAGPVDKPHDTPPIGGGRPRGNSPRR